MIHLIRFWVRNKIEVIKLDEDEEEEEHEDHDVANAKIILQQKSLGVRSAFQYCHPRAKANCKGSPN